MHTLYIAIFDPELTSVTEIVDGDWSVGGRWQNLLIMKEGPCRTIAPFDEVDWEAMIGFNPEGHSSWHGRPDAIITPDGFIDADSPEKFRQALEDIKVKAGHTRLAVYTIDVHI